MAFIDLANPTRFLAWSARILPWLAGAAVAVLALGLGLAFCAPADYQQGEMVRIMYIHVPFAWLSMFGYSMMAASALGILVWRHPLADVAHKAAAPIGATFTFLCLVTGALWGRPMWGTYWVWDARLTSMLVLLFLYLGYLALSASEAEKGGESRASSILALVGVINLPIIKYSVEWWNTLHQGSSISVVNASSKIAPELLTPLLLSVAGFSFLFAAIVLMRMRAMLAQQRVDARSRRMAEALA